MDAERGHTNHWMSTDRFAFDGDLLTADFNAQSHGGRLEGGYRFATGFVGIAPVARSSATTHNTHPIRPGNISRSVPPARRSAHAAMWALRKSGVRFRLIVYADGSRDFSRRCRGRSRWSDGRGPDDWGENCAPSRDHAHLIDGSLSLDSFRVGGWRRRQPWAMCGRLRVGKDFLHVAALVGAAMCSAYERGSHDRWP